MDKWKYIYWGIVLLLLVPGIAKAQQTNFSLEDVNRVKHLIVDIVNAQNETLGAGIVTGVKSNYLYIVTANHIVRHRGNQAHKSPSYRVKFYGLPTSFEAELMPFFDAEHDVAVLEIRQVREKEVPHTEIPFNKLGIPSDLKIGSALHVIGHPRAGWDFNVSPYRLKSALDYELIMETPQGFSKGNSGGGLFNHKWELVGMVLDTDGEEASSLSMTRLLEILGGNSWRIPIDLRRPLAERALRITDHEFAPAPRNLTYTSTNQALAAQDFVVADTLVIDGAVLEAPVGAVYVANALRMRNGGAIVGSDFTVVATTIAGGRLDASGQDGAEGVAGTRGPEPGHPGGRILIATAAIDGTALLAGGGNGGRGATGRNGQDGIRGRDGRKGDCAGFGAWKAAQPGQDGQDGTDGEDGQNGAPGGNAGQLIILISSDLLVEPVAQAGVGGAGGHGGHAGRGGAGGRGGKGCIGLGGAQDTRPNGSRGLDGRAGRPGQAGADGLGRQPLINSISFRKVVDIYREQWANKDRLRRAIFGLPDPG